MNTMLGNNNKAILYIKRIVGILTFALIWYILVSGIDHVLHIIMSDSWFYAQLGHQDERVPLGSALTAVGSFIILPFVYKGYEFYRDKHWGFGFTKVIDRDKTIYILEKFFNVSQLRFKHRDLETDTANLYREQISAIYENIDYIVKLVDEKNDPIPR